MFLWDTSVWPTGSTFSSEKFSFFLIAFLRKVYELRIISNQVKNLHEQHGYDASDCSTLQSHSLFSY